MAVCVACGIYFGNPNGQPDFCPACHLLTHREAFGNRPRPAIPVTRPTPVPVETTVTLTIAKAKLPPSKIARAKRSRYDLISEGGLDLGVHSEEGSDVLDA